MSAPLPNALRARFQKLVEEGLSGRSAALRLEAFARHRGALGPCDPTHADRPEPRLRDARRGKGKLDPHRSFPRLSLIDQDGDMTMPELAGALADATGVQAHPDAIGRFLRKLGFTYKSKEEQKTIQ